MVKDLGSENSLLNKFMSEIRDDSIQNDSMRFRRNLERVGEIFAYEISKTFNYNNVNVKTPLGIKEINLFDNKVVLATILRAGLPMHQGFLNYFDDAENSFISAYRKYDKDEEFDIRLEYISSPDLNDKTLIICDPMLATGASMNLTCKSLLKYGKPAHIHIVTLIAHKDGINHLKKNLPIKNKTIWTGAIDNELTVKAYIVPGLGDAGDLAFGPKE